MKVRVTFEITDTDRIAISVAQGKGFTPAPREDIEAYVTGVVTNRLDQIGEAFTEATDKLLEQLKV
jgi:hypothetical protein